METVRITKRTEADGTLSLKIPLGRPEAEYEILIVVHPKVVFVSEQEHDGRGWPSGYFEETYGSIQDETFVRPPQGELPHPVELE
ncbi:MAG TPA: hypothetical protein VNQ76_06955 [Planctomicrobium sp.]|nr:hypothetical protein [Planctomicrobium sp.]